jgi:hypothetical protein
MYFLQRLKSSVREAFEASLRKLSRTVVITSAEALGGQQVSRLDYR